MKRKILLPIFVLLAGTALFINGCKKDDDDTEAPVITIAGNNPDNVVLNSASSYSDASATASDNEDGSVAVSTSGSVDMTTAGSYTITYTAHDAAGNSASAARTVNVNIERVNYVWAGYSADDSSASTGAFGYSGTISAGSSANGIIISNFSGTLANCVATISGSTVTIANQTVGSLTNVSGTGTMNNKGDVITINYTATLGSSTDTYHAVFTKQ
jgi:hypothetical protein